MSATELQQIREQLETLNRHRFVRNHNSMPRMLWMMFIKGIAFGLGSVLGATIVVSLLISALGQIEFIPIVGEWAMLIMDEINSNQR